MPSIYRPEKLLLGQRRPSHRLKKDQKVLTEVIYVCGSVSSSSSFGNKNVPSYHHSEMGTGIC